MRRKKIKVPSVQLQYGNGSAPYCEMHENVPEEPSTVPAWDSLVVKLKKLDGLLQELQKEKDFEETPRQYSVATISSEGVPEVVPNFIQFIATASTEPVDVDKLTFSAQKINP